jgi:hypothetical protein
MAKRDSSRTEQIGEIVAGSLALASLILVDSTALHFLFGVPLFLYCIRNFNKPSSISDRVIVSIAMSIALLLCFSPLINYALNKFGMARFWDIILLILGTITTTSFFIVKWKYELKTSRGIK